MIRYFLVFITKREKKRGLPPLSSPLLSSPLLSKALLSFPSSKKQKTLLLKKNAKKEKTRAQNKPKRDKTKQHPRAYVFKTKRKNGLSRSRTKEKVGSGAVGGGEIETTEHALVRAIIRHGVLREPRWEAGKERGEEERWRVKNW